MYRILRTLVLKTDFDSPDAEQRIRQLLQGSADGVVNSIASSGHTYAQGAAEANLTPMGSLNQQVRGLNQVKLIASLASRPESEGLSDIIQKLKTIQRMAFHRSNKFRAALTCGSESVSQNESALRSFISSLPKNNNKPHKVHELSPSGFSRNTKTFYPLPYQVYYGALAVPTVSYTSPEGAPLQILAQLLTHKHLHHEIREKGGAYGGGAYSRGMDGIFGFYSYRDPNPLNTISIMRNAGQWAVEKKWSDRDLEEAKLSVFQSIDAPKSVSREGMDRFLYRVTDEMVQERRERLLDVTKDQVREVAQEYIVERLDNDEGSMVFLGEKKPWIDRTWDIRDMGIAQPEPTIQDEEDMKEAALGS
jgi:Zn-dependent M16 (insulinase) family peptidase